MPHPSTPPACDVLPRPIESGLHVLVEKPLGMDLAEAASHLALAQSNVQALGDAAALAGSLELAPLTAERARSLLRA